MPIISLKQAIYLATTDFNLLGMCMQANLSILQYRILHYINSCLNCGIEECDLGVPACWLEIDALELYQEIIYLQLNGFVKGLRFSKPSLEEVN